MKLRPININLLKKRSEDERLRPRHHAGTGFIQVYLKKNLRLHILHPDFPPTRNDSGIHNHRFSFHSRILRGRLVNSVYGLRAGTDHEVYEVYCGSAGSKEFKVIDPVKVGACGVELIGQQSFMAGDEYTFEIGQFHSSKADELTVTLMEKLWEGHENSRVIVPTGTPMRSAFEDQPPVDRLWEIIEHVLSSLEVLA